MASRVVQFIEIDCLRSLLHSLLGQLMQPAYRCDLGQLFMLGQQERFRVGDKE